jgi:hypothetical protein
MMKRALLGTASPSVYEIDEQAWSEGTIEVAALV